MAEVFRFSKFAFAFLAVKKADFPKIYTASTPIRFFTTAKRPQSEISASALKTPDVKEFSVTNTLTSFGCGLFIEKKKKRRFT